jgi:hypothetical protein
MDTYLVSISWSCYATKRVEAKSADEAREKSWGQDTPDDYDYGDTDIDDVTLAEDEFYEFKRIRRRKRAKVRRLR